MKPNYKVLNLVKERLELGQKKYGQDIPLKGEGGRDNLKESVEEILDLTVYLGAVLLEVKENRDKERTSNRKTVSPEEIKMLLKGLHMLYEESYRENQVAYASKVQDLINSMKSSSNWNETDERSIGRTEPYTKCIEGSNCD